MIHEVNLDYNFGAGIIPLIITYEEDEEDWDNNFIEKIAVENSEQDLYTFLQYLDTTNTLMDELLELAERKISSKDAKIEGILDDMKNKGVL